MRRTIKQQPMSLQEISERKEQAEQRIHSADGLVATAEQRLAEIKEVYEAYSKDAADMDIQREAAEESLNKWEALSRQAEKDKKELEEQVRSKRDALTALEVEAVTLELKMEEERKTHALAIKDELAKLNEAKEKARKEFQDICAIVEERKQKNKSLEAAAAKLAERIVSLETQIPALEAKGAEIEILNQTILERKNAIVSISEEYARNDELASLEAKRLEELRRASAQEEKRAEEIRASLAIEEAEIKAKRDSLRVVQDGLEQTRARMLRAEKDAAAKEFLTKGY